MLDISNLQKTYTSNGKKISVLRDVSCHINRGEVVSIIGPSGSGKSTFLRCLNRLEIPDSGSILLDGINVLDKKTNINKIRQKMGMVFQTFNLFEHLNALDNVAFGPVEILGIAKTNADAKAMEMLRMVGLAEKAYMMPSELSGGQKQRVAIARSMAVNPDLMLLDEPTSALDPAMVVEVTSVIKRLAQKGMTMVIVTHEMDLARDVSNRIFFMDNGIILEDGTPEQIFEHPQHYETRVFVNKMRCLTFHVTSRDYDLYEMNSSIQMFCQKYSLDKKYITIQLFMEEMLTKILPMNAPVHISINYVQAKHSLIMEFEQEGFFGTIMERPDLDELSLSIIQGLCSDIKEEATEKGEKVTMTL